MELFYFFFATALALILLGFIGLMTSSTLARSLFYGAGMFVGVAFLWSLEGAYSLTFAMFLLLILAIYLLLYPGKEGRQLLFERYLPPPFPTPLGMIATICLGALYLWSVLESHPQPLFQLKRTPVPLSFFLYLLAFLALLGLIWETSREEERCRE